MNRPISHYARFVAFQVIANLKSETSRNYLSYLWWIIEPVLQMLLFYVVFGVLLRRGTENFVVFLMTGLIPWLWFNKSVNQGMNSIQQGKGLMMQVHIPKIIFPTVSIIQNTIKQMVVMVLLLFFLFFAGVSPSIHWLTLPLLLITEFMMIACCTYALALVVPFLPDLRVIIPFFLQALMFGSGVFYNLNMISPRKRELFYLLNPMANLLANYRAVLLKHRLPNVEAMLIITIVSFCICCFLFYLAAKLDRVYPRVV